MAKFFHPDGHKMCVWEVVCWANEVHRMAGGKGRPFSQWDFIEPDFLMVTNGKSDNYRLSGDMCECGFDAKSLGKSSLGEFELLPMDSEEVQEGKKVYMRCRVCGCYSHL